MGQYYHPKKQTGNEYARAVKEFNAYVIHTLEKPPAEWNEFYLKKSESETTVSPSRISVSSHQTAVNCASGSLGDWWLRSRYEDYIARDVRGYGDCNIDCVYNTKRVAPGFV